MQEVEQTLQLGSFVELEKPIYSRVEGKNRLEIGMAA
jgi:hypothetical protein